MPAKRYFWWKLPDTFFSEKVVRKLRRLPNGGECVCAYLEILLVTMKTDGLFHIDGIENDPIAELALAVDEDENTVRQTMEVLPACGHAVSEGTDFRFPAALDGVGSEGSSAQRMRIFRSKEIECHNVTERREKQKKSE